MNDDFQNLEGTHHVFRGCWPTLIDNTWSSQSFKLVPIHKIWTYVLFLFQQYLRFIAVKNIT